MGINNSGRDKKDTESTDKNYITASTADIQNHIDDAQKLGVLKKIEPGNYFYDNPNEWNNTSIDKNKILCKFFADYAKTKRQYALL